jgi:hypothetical protein
VINYYYGYYYYYHRYPDDEGLVMKAMDANVQQMQLVWENINTLV